MGRVLFIDCQQLQTMALHRGMGKYTLAVLNEYKKQKLPYEDVVVLLGSEPIDPVDEQFIDKSLEGFTICRLPFKKTNPAKPHDYMAILEYNRDLLDRYIKKNYSHVAVDCLITSMFYEDGCSAFPSSAVNKYLLIYDLIPLQFPEYYLHDVRGREQYLSRYKELFNATHYFAISNTVANDLAMHLGIPHDRITPINGSSIKRKHLKTKPLEQLGANEKFILMPTGDDVRKNNLRAVLAFEEFNSKSGYAYKMVLTSFFGEKTKTELLMHSNHLIFSGNISEEELAWLYDNADLVLFPSEYEGLGMPALEAVEFSKPVLCSSIDVFKEISENGFYYCDPYDFEDISKQLQKLLINNKPKVDRAEYERIFKLYSWRTTAKLTIKYFNQKDGATLEAKRKPRIAVFCPAPSGYSAIGKVVQEQHYELSRLAEVDYYLEQGITPKALDSNVRVNFLPYIADCHNPWSFDGHEAAKYDKVIYHIGNSEYHLASIVKALAYPGDIVLHDSRLGEIFSLLRDRGYISVSRFQQEQALQAAIGRQKSQPTAKGEAIASLVNSAQKVVVHSDYAHAAVAAMIIEETSISKITKINLPTPTPFVVYDMTYHDRFVAGYAGVIHKAKGLDLVTAISAKKYTKPLSIKLFGFSLLSEEAQSELSSISTLTMVLKPSDSRFIHELETCNVIVGFRPDYHGETSLSTLEAMRLGRPVIVNNIGWFAEIPEPFVYKVANKDDIVAQISTLVERPEDHGVSIRRVEYIRRHHSLKAYVSELVGEV